MDKSKNKTFNIFLYSVLAITVILLGLVVYIMTNGEKASNNDTKQVSGSVEEKNINKTEEPKSATIGDILNAIDETNKEQKVQINPKDIIRIKGVTTSSPNSAGGVDLNVKWTNMSDKTIKYITFTAYPVNAVGDVVYSDINRYALGKFRGQETGPIEKGQGNKAGWVFENAWYNNTIIKANLTQIDIEYMDGTRQILNQEEIEQAIY